tara:strand:+ start:2482 stop:3234 length:753 start_codon:yes stop_codon:yes gene_type:complete
MMLDFNRREVLFGGLLTVIGGTCAVPCAAQWTSEGCGIPQNETQGYFARATRAPQMAANGGFVIEPRSGDSALDYAFAQALGHMVSTFGVKPGFTYYDDYDGPNAKATSNAMLEYSDGTVLFGLRFLRMLLENPNHREAGIVAFAAHEFGHIVSFKNGMIGPLSRARGVFGGEQYADYMSGYFAGRRKRISPSYPATAFAGTIGDYAGGPHGDRRLRSGAIERGFLDAYQRELSMSQAEQAAYSYAMSSG